MRALGFGAICAGLAAAATMVGAGGAAAPSSDEVPAPTFKSDDSWVYDFTQQSLAAGFQEYRLRQQVERVESESLILGVKKDGAPTAFEDHILGPDLSHRELINGELTTTVRPLAFPLSPGKTWSVDYVDPIRRGDQLSAHVKRTYKVVGWEDVTVPAGTFRTLKIESHGVDDGTFQFASTAVAAGAVAPGAATTMTQTHRGGVEHISRAESATLWYAPALRNFAKTVEDQYRPDGVRTGETTMALTSFKLAD